MGIVNATPDSFSDGGLHPTAEARVELALELAEQGATIIDVGGQWRDAVARDRAHEVAHGALPVGQVEVVAHLGSQATAVARR